MRELPEEILNFFSNETNLKKAFEISSALEKFKWELIDNFKSSLRRQLLDAFSENDYWLVSDQTLRGQRGIGLEYKNKNNKHPVTPWIGFVTYSNRESDPWIFLNDINGSQNKIYDNLSEPLKEFKVVKNKTKSYYRYIPDLWPFNYKAALALLDESARTTKVHEVKNEILQWKRIAERELGL